MNIEKFKNHLISDEKSESTVSRYVCDVTAYITWLDGRGMSKELISAAFRHGRICKPALKGTGALDLTQPYSKK